MVTLSLVVDRATVPDDHPLHDRQEEGVASMQRLARASPKIRLLVTETEGKPKVLDLMGVASKTSSTFMGFLNSDLLVQPSFAESMTKWGPYDAIRVRRTDVPGGPLHTPSAEGIIMKRDVWLKHRSSLPEGFVLGEPGWDTCWIAWLHHLKLKVGRLDNGEVLHPVHPTPWKDQSYWSFRNTGIMYVWFSRTMGHRKGWLMLNSHEYWAQVDAMEEVI